MKYQGVLILTLLFSLCSCTSPSSYLTKEDIDNMIDSISQTQKENGLFNDNLRDTFFAVESLSILSKPVNKKEAICSFLKKGNFKDVEQVFYASSLKKKLKM